MWTRWAKSRPPETMVVDVIFPSDQEILEVWMVCSIIADQVEMLNGLERAFWRPADKNLPAEVVVSNEPSTVEDVDWLTDEDIETKKQAALEYLSEWQHYLDSLG